MSNTINNNAGSTPQIQPNNDPGPQAGAKPDLKVIVLDVLLNAGKNFFAGLLGGAPKVNVDPPKAKAPVEKKTKSTSGSETKAFTKYQSMDPGKMSVAMANNPDAFWKDMGKMTMEERGQIQMKLQNHMQSVNQMMTMMSTLSQAAHDTSKAIIGNMRV
ncbi:MAG: hypothetical protein H0U74_16175 [Bradymonadaceae bacterium]|nr:hypothetical protein [Lujinxingiaceae bacterium]